MRLVLAYLLCSLLGTGGPALAQSRRTAKPRAPLTSAQVEQLLRIGTPDDVISEEIRERGLAVPPTRADLDRLSTRGAGAQTMAALRALARGSVLVISKPGECEVLIDGRYVGRTRADGQLTLPLIEAGDHTVYVNKEGFQPAEFPIRVEPASQASVAAALETKRGSLSVLASVPEATIRINGVGSYRGAARNVACPAGSYVVEVTAPGFKPAQQAVAVQPGRASEIAVALEPDDATLDRLRQQMRDRNPAASSRAAEQLLRYLPADPEAQAALAVSYFAAGNAAAFRPAAEKAIAAGGSLRLRVVHHHGYMTEHEALLEIAPNRIGFDSLGAPCTVRTAEIERARLVRVAAVRDRAVRGGRHVPEDYVDIVYRAQAKGDKTSSMKLRAPQDSREDLVQALCDVVRALVPSSGL